MLKPVLRGLRRLASVARRARLIARSHPPELWYASAVRWARLQWWVCRLLPWRPDVLRRNAVFLDHLLASLDTLGPFPVPFRITGAELLHAERGGTGLAYCSAHLPLFSLQLRALLEQHGPAPLVIALQTAIGDDGCYPITGAAQRIRALGPGPRAMVRVRTELANGGAVASMLDEYAGGPLRPHLMQLASRVGARILFVWSELAPDGAACIWFTEPPFPVANTEEEVRANLAALDQGRQEILARAGQRAQPVEAAIRSR